MKKLLGVGLAGMVAAACLAGAPTAAEAGCEIYSAVPVRIDYDSTGAWIYFRRHLWYNNYGGAAAYAYDIHAAVLGPYWYARVPTSTPQMAAMASTFEVAIKSQTRVGLSGNAATCPASSSVGGIGDLLTIRVNP